MRPIARRLQSDGKWDLIIQALAFAVIVAVSLAAVHIMAEISSTGRVTGKIFDAKNHEPLGFANIVVVGTTVGAMSVADGAFEINNVPTGKQMLRVMMMGYKTVIDTIEVYPDSTLSLEYALEETIVATTQEILVTGERKNVDVTSSDVRSGRPQAIRPSPDPLSAIRLKTGIAKTGDRLHARGGRSGEMRSRDYGLPVPDPLAKTQPSSKVTKKMTTVVERPATPAPRREPPDQESYAPVYESDFFETIDNPYSTFAVDVDAASYSNIRRFVRTGQLPPSDAVRIEEMVNYFTYDYPEPDGRDPFSITVESSRCPWNQDDELVRIALQGKHVDIEEAPPSNLVFLLDVSGSMRPPNKLPLLRRAFVALTDNLRDDDRIAIVTFSSGASVRLESTRGAERDRIRDAIMALNACGSTAGGAGIELAYNMATENLIDGGNNRVILATDGDFNVGLSSNSAMVQLIGAKRDQGVFLTVLGFGEANIKDDKLEQIADHGNGHYAYIDDIFEARRVLVNELGATLFTIAKDVKIQVEFNPAKVESYRLIGYENRLLADRDFEDDTKDAGDIGAGHAVTALYEVVPSHQRSRVVRQRTYTEMQITEAAFASPEMLTVRFRYKRPDADESRLVERTFEPTNADFDEASADFRFAASVVEFGLLLRSSAYAGDSSYKHVLATARASVGTDDGGYRHEFVRLVEMCRDLTAP